MKLNNEKLPVPSLLHSGVEVAPQFTHSRPSIICEKNKLIY